MPSTVGIAETRPAQDLRRPRWLGLSLWSLALVLVGTLYAVQPDVLAAAVLVPVWCWCLTLAVWLILAHPARRVRSLGLLCVLGLWFWQGEEPLPLARSLIPEWAEPRANARITTFNCAGSADAAREVFSDRGSSLYLLQEVPGRQSLELTAQGSFGASGVTVIASRDCAIVSSGDLERLAEDARGRWVVARWNRRVVIASIRLQPPAPRLDFWTAGFWSDHAGVRRRHREEISELLAVLKRVAPGEAYVIGGDFNAPANDAAWEELRREAIDVFGQVGRGWPHTATSDIPLFRVDLLWATPNLVPERSVVLRSRSSDHRSVESALVLPSRD